MKQHPPGQTIIVGAGYTGHRLARSLEHTHTLALVQSTGSLERLRDARVPAVRLDIDTTDALPDGIENDACIVYLVPPSRDTDGDARLARFLALLPDAGRFVYVSTTGVYGDCGGATVDESRPPAPRTARARRRVDAERQVRRWCEARSVPWVILRVPGIYGPGRLQLASLDSQQPAIARDEASPGNRIHVDDLVGALEAAIVTEHTDRVFNVGDGDVATQVEFLSTVARLTGRSPPPTVSMETARREFSPMRLSFLEERRHVDVSRMLGELGVELHYPDHESGIRASLDEQERGPG